MVSKIMYLGVWEGNIRTSIKSFYLKKRKKGFPNIYSACCQWSVGETVTWREPNAEGPGSELHVLSSPLLTSGRGQCVTVSVCLVNVDLLDITKSTLIKWIHIFKDLHKKKSSKVTLTVVTQMLVNKAEAS